MSFGNINPFSGIDASTALNNLTAMGPASALSNGYLLATDWVIFNAKEPAITKLSAFNKAFGVLAGTVAEGNDSRILNGQTAYGWGDHAGLYSASNHNHTLDSLSNVTIVSNSNGEILRWTGTAWVNNTLDEAGIFKLDQTTPQTVINGSPTMEGIQFDITPSTTNNAEGLLRWNSTDGTLDLGMQGGDVIMQIGQELFAKVRNDQGADITDGQVVYISGRTGVYPDIRLARADDEDTAQVLGVATHVITNSGNKFGYVTILGYVRSIKTNYSGAGIWGTTWVTGDKLYVSKTTAGQLTNVEPSAPHHSDIVATVGIVSATQGSILVTINHHKTLQELTDVNGTALSVSGQIPVWNNTAGYFDFTSNISNFQASNSNLTSLAGLSYASASFVKMTGVNTFTLDTNTYLTSVTAHNLLSSIHGDTTAASVVRGDIITGQGSTASWARLAFPGMPTGKVLVATATDVVWSTNALGTAAWAATGDFYASNNPSSFIALTNLSSSATGLTYTNTTGVFSLTTGYVIPTTTQESNWGSAYSAMHNAVTLATDSGLSLSTQVLNMGTPSSVTASSTNSVSTNTHTHAVSGFATTIHNLIDTTNHPVSGLTNGHFLKATGATTYGFGAHGLTYSDVSALPFAIATDTNFTTGFVATYDGVGTPDSTISFNTSNKVFTIAPTGASFSYYSSGTKYTKSAPDTVSLASGWANNTLYYVYYVGSTLTASTSEWDITGGGIPITTILWNGTSSNVVMGEERHSAKRNGTWHEWAHDNIGSKITSGFDATSITSSGTIIGSGVMSDEDIHVAVSTQTDSVRIVYRSGGTLTYDDNLAAITAKVVGGVLKYDNAGTLTSVADGYYIKNVVLATNSIWGPISCRIAQSEHADINAARNSTPPSATTYLSNETREIYSVIWQNVGGTPTLIEYTDWRSAPTLPSGFVAKTPTFLGGLQDTLIVSPAVDNVLKWNGSTWVNGSGTTQGSSPGISFYNATPVINSRTAPAGINQAGTAGNGVAINSLSKTPVTTAEQTITGTANGDTRLIVAWLYGTALGRTTIDAGAWDFTTFASITSISGTQTNTRNIYQVVPVSSGSVTITGAGANSRTATITSGQFTGTYFNANATNTLASYLQTPSGIYQITAAGTTNSATITVPTGYSNESAVTFKIWNLLFSAGAVSLTSTAIAQYNQSVVQPAFTIAATDMLGQMGFFTSNNSKTITVYYNGTTHNSHWQTPLITLHNNLAGLQGGSGTEFYHSTLAEYTGSGSGVFARVTSPIFTTPNIGTATGSASLNLLLTGGTLTGNLLFSADNTLDIGANGATRPRTGYFGTSVIAPAFTGTASKATNMVGGNSTTLLGSIGYQSNTDTTTLLSPNTTTTKKYLTQTGTGTNGAVPVWDTILAADVAPKLNDAWWQSLDYAGNVANVMKLSKDNLITFGGELDLNHLYHVTNAGLNDIVHIPITGVSPATTEHGVAIKLGTERIFKISTQSDGDGTWSGTNTSVLKGNFTVTEGNIILTAGSQTITAGNLTITAGSQTITAGSLNITAGSVNFANDTWMLTAKDYVGNTQNILKLSKDNILEFAPRVGINSFYDVLNTELHDIVNIPVSATSPSGTVHGVSVTVAGLKLLEVAGTSDGSGGISGGYIKIPCMTTGQRDAIINPAEGMLCYNLTTHALNYRSDSTWAAV